MSERVDLLDGRVTLYRGDCREILMTLGKVDAVARYAAAHRLYGSRS